MKARLRRRSIAAAALASLLVTAATEADIAGFGDFSQFSINTNDGGTAPTFPSPGTIQLINGPSESRSIFYNTRQAVSQFTATFTYQVFNPGTDEGATFMLQNDPNGASAVGTSNHGRKGILNNALISFNIGDNDTALSVNGSPLATGPDMSPVVLASGDPINVRFDYSASSLTETLVDTVTLAQFTLTQPFSIAAAVGDSSAFVGLTAGSSTDSVDQLFSNFQFTNTVPEPAVFGLLMVAVPWGLYRRRQARA